MIPFRLKNAGATYQRLVNKMFRDHIRRNVEVYVDDMLVKNIQAANQHNEGIQDEVTWPNVLLVYPRVSS
jgi:hypothetical protein